MVHNPSSPPHLYNSKSNILMVMEHNFQRAMFFKVFLSLGSNNLKALKKNHFQDAVIIKGFHLHPFVAKR